jgi:hypothetical protein
LEGERSPVLVLGDLAIDQLLLPRPPSCETPDFDWRRHHQYIFWNLRGGVALSEVVLRDLGYKPSLHESPSSDFVLHTLSRLFEMEARGPTGSGQAGKTQLRVARFEGYFPKPRAGAEESQASLDTSQEVSSGAFKLIFINDAGGAARAKGSSAVDALKSAIGPDSLIVHKAHLPLTTDNQFAAILAASSFAGCVLVMCAADLRASGERLRTHLSWEATLEDIAALSENAESLLGRALNCYSAVVVLASEDGAFSIAKTTEGLKVSMAVAADGIEGSFDSLIPGDLYGQTNLFSCALLWQLDQTGSVTPQSAHLSNALAVTRDYASRNIEVSSLDGREKPALPKPRVDAATLARHKTGLLTRDFAGFGEVAALWASSGDVLSLARRIVCEGPEALADLPHARFGAFLTIDRVEIEGFREIRTLIQGYLSDETQSKPVSLGVFGPPGSGKSFGIKQLVGDRDLVVREYNLSETSADALKGYFHELRDIGLEGKTPLCFFDEFDSRGCEMVAHFLAPMQDGTFRDGPRTHPIGRAILVFAGGTAASVAAFTGRDLHESMRDVVKREERLAWMRAVKIPDFVSRLAGVIDIRGINQATDGGGAGDQAYVLRRAVLLRSLLERYRKDIFTGQGDCLRIQLPLLGALLETDDYRFGARSMEKIIKASALHNGRPIFGASDLPGKGLLAMHLTAPERFQEMAFRPDQ